MTTMCAIDHTGAHKRALNEKNPDAVSYEDIVDFKLDLCQGVAPFTSAILLNPEYGAGQAIAAGLLPRFNGLLVSVKRPAIPETLQLGLLSLCPNGA